jgi:ABC-type nitrate/sulfonate/bicarbonate transport system substrate-binding protein
MNMRALCCLLAVLMVATCGAFAQAPKLTPIRVVTLFPSLPIVVAQKNGYFTRHGIELQEEHADNSNILRDMLASGKADVAHAAVDNAVYMVEGSGADVAIVMGGDGATNELIVQPDVKSVADLRGRILLVDAVNTAYALQLKKILMLSGLQAGRDCTLKALGATPLRLKAMRENKQYAGTMLGAPTSIVARREGFVSLGSTLQFIGPYQGFGAFVRRQWAREHAQVLERYLAAYIEAQRWLLNTANKQQVISLLTSESHLPPDVAAETYADMVRPGGYEPDARFDAAAFKNTLKLRAEVEGEWGSHPPAPGKYYDGVYYTKALSMLKKGVQ